MRNHLYNAPFMIHLIFKFLMPVAQITAVQHTSPAPFGDLSKCLYGLNKSSIWRA